MSGPEIHIFKCFKNNSNQIYRTVFCTMENDTEVKQILQNLCEDILIFCKNTLNINLPMDDYSEFLE